ncbi:lysine--tRNA ligase [Thiosulfativibrio zosterae]|uniref:Lysine--tRNA ligase n=1 Tax=Thiosulfativibrio zosterae TaxID=2675053 RepID=A0A6F8PN00_9GAMM|nr:lysine--tRNA ligase [Thiosulfativibrio zosterae]BBP43466.1 lysine--tRNA ligase [Thiosulfativibrio zosterae]
MSNDNQNTPEAVAVDENKIIAERRAKLTALRKDCPANAHPNKFRRDAMAADLHEKYDAIEKEAMAEMEPIRVKVSGRMMLRRIMGKASFATLQDMSGRIQIYVTRDDLPENFYNEQFKKWDLGDIVAAEGFLFKTNTGELSIHVERIELLTKSLRPMPDKFHGLHDKEIRYRQRYIDLMVNQESRDVFQMRSKIVAHVRAFLTRKGFMEVETPMMHVIPGGASAKPFNTHHNALDMPLFLRIAPELYLKRLIVGGFEKVFEINRSFRNEGLSTRHNPEFTMVEFYEAYEDYVTLMDHTEELLKELAVLTKGQTEFEYQGQVFDFGKPFDRLTMKESVLKYNPSISMEQLEDLEQARALAKKLHCHIEESYGIGRVVTEIFEATVEEKLIQPTFITEYPAEISPLARRNDENPEVTDRFELFIGGRELANGFSELNDAEDQAERFKAQVEAKDAGDEEAMHYDEDYITALEYGMPPTAGEGIGIDRLVMLFTNSASIRDVLLFPHMRPVE